MVGMDSHFYEQTSPLNSSFDSKASSRAGPKCASPALQHSAHGSEVIPTDLNSPELTFDHMSIQQFIRSELSNVNHSSSSNILEEYPSLVRPSDKNSANVTSSEHQHHHNLQASGAASVQSSVNSVVNSLHGTPVSVSHSSPHFSAYPNHSPMPQQPSLGTDRYGLEASPLVKQEPHEPEVDFPNNCSQSSLFSNPFVPNYGNDARIPNVSTNRSVDGGENNMLRQMHFSMGSNAAVPQGQGRQSHSSRNKGHSKKSMDKGTDEYKKRRERNNIAVRKSREKAKVRSRETEKKVSELARENDQLRKKVDSLCKELNVLKSLLTTVGVPPESVDSEIAKGLQMEGHVQAGYGM